jgi:DNA-binding response OmpR family regulator
MRLALVEDDFRLARGYQRQLERAGHHVTVYPDAESAYEPLRRDAQRLHVIMLDILLPGQSGVALCRTLRRDGVRTPILMLTALDQTTDKVAGLDAGADDYLTKPFPFDELLARLRALIRRAPGFDLTAGATEIRAGSLVIDRLQREVYLDDRLITLTPREYALLEYLATQANRVLSRDQITARVWPDGTEACSNVLDTYIHHLRDKLGDYGDEQMIQTVRGVGYILRTASQHARQVSSQA